MDPSADRPSYDEWLSQMKLRGYDASINPAAFRQAYDNGLTADEYANAMIAHTQATKSSAKSSPVGCIVLAVIMVVGYMGCSSSCENSSRQAEATRAAEESDNAAKLAAEINSDPKRGPKPIPSEWDAITPEANAFLKQTLKDYKSMEIVECSAVIEWGKDKWAQRVKYRAKNSFGGMALENQVFVIRDGKVVDVTDFPL